MAMDGDIRAQVVQVDRDQQVISEVRDLEAAWVNWIAIADQWVTVERTDGSTTFGRVVSLGFGGIVLESETGQIERVLPERIRQIREREPAG